MSSSLDLPVLTDWNLEKNVDRMKAYLENNNIESSSKYLRGDLIIKCVTHEWKKYKIAWDTSVKTLLLPKDSATMVEFVKNAYKQQEELLEIKLHARLWILRDRISSSTTQTRKMKEQAIADKQSLIKEFKLQQAESQDIVKDLANQQIDLTEDSDNDKPPANSSTPLFSTKKLMFPLAIDEIFAEAARISDAPDISALRKEEEELLETSSILQDEIAKNHRNVLYISSVGFPSDQDVNKFLVEIQSIAKSFTSCFLRMATDDHSYYAVFNGDSTTGRVVLKLKREKVGKSVCGHKLTLSFFPSDMFKKEQANQVIANKKKVRYREEDDDMESVGKSTQGLRNKRQRAKAADDVDKPAKKAKANSTGATPAKEKDKDTSTKEGKHGMNPDDGDEK